LGSPRNEKPQKCKCPGVQRHFALKTIEFAHIKRKERQREHGKRLRALQRKNLFEGAKRIGTPRGVVIKKSRTELTYDPVTESRVSAMRNTVHKNRNKKKAATLLEKDAVQYEGWALKKKRGDREYRRELGQDNKRDQQRKKKG